MTQVEKLYSLLMTKPRTFRFRDFVRVRESLGYELEPEGQPRAGSRVRFYRESDGRMLVMHSPHPSDEMTGGAIKAAVKFLHGEERL